MARIVFQHEAFRLELHAPDLARRVAEAHGNGLSNDALKCVWTWDGGVSAILWAEEDGEEPTAIWTETGAEARPDRAFFFDNADLDVWIEFSKGCSKGRVELARAADEARFQSRGDRWLYGPLAFGNDIGRADFAVSWEQDGIRKRFRVSFDVLSTKLDYRTDWQRIVQDVEDEYRMLSYDFLRRTYHQFRDNPDGDNTDRIWWEVFKAWQNRFFDACDIVIHRPRTRHRRTEEFRRADRLGILTPALENELAENRTNPAHLYRVERPETTRDTPENRFVKHAVLEIARRHARLARRVRDMAEKRGASETHGRWIEQTGSRLGALEKSPFFRGIGRFEGLRQVSLVLQQAPGYAEIVRVWAVLMRLYALGEGLCGLETKDIAELYEIWCFIEVKNRAKAVLECGPPGGGALPSGVRVCNQSRGELGELFGTDLAKGRKSRVVLERKDTKNGDVRLELFYNPKAEATDGTTSARSSIDQTEAPTGGEQKPDIVLQLVREHGGRDGFRLTYLFDAKYRIDGKTADGTVDKPPEDAINQMHRYRDAIYYSGGEEGTDPRLKREVIGGYVLFPGNGKPEDFARANFRQSINSVNIGALPLRPGNEENGKALEDFIRNLLEKKTEDHLLGMPSQAPKGTRLWPEGDLSAMGIVFVPSFDEKFRADGYKSGFPKAVEETNLCPVPTALVKTPPDVVRLIVFPSVKGVDVFSVRDGGVPKTSTKKEDVPSEFLTAMEKNAGAKKKGDPNPLPSPEYWVFGVTKNT